MEKLSVMILTRNEESNIRECLESVKWVDEIVLVDSLSTDKTLEIARGYTDKIFSVEPTGFVEPYREFAASKASNSWILYLDADERVSSSLQEEITSLLNSQEEKRDAYFIARKVFFLNKWIRGCGWYPSYTIRLFKRGKVFFPKEFFEDGRPLGSFGYLKEHIIHYSYRNLTEYFSKFNRYTSLAAEKEYKNGARVSAVNFIIFFLVKPLYWFSKKYFLMRGFLDGIRGLIISFCSAVGIFVIYAKLWERQVALEKT